MPRRIALASLLAAALAAPCATLAAEPATAPRWAADFRSPPASAHPQIWWHWMNGNVTRVGITADLEAMHRIGIGEANIITVASAIPPGPVPVMSPPFFDMVQFAAGEAQRLGMTLCIDNCPGWSSSGGPWVTPEHAMQFVTTSETKVHGPAPFVGKLAQPATKANFYRDIAVLSFKTPAGEDDRVDPADAPKITTTAPGVDPASLVTRGSRRAIKFPIPSPGHEYAVQLDFPRPMTWRTLTLVAGPMREATGVISAADDGQHFRDVGPFTVPRNAALPVNVSLGNQPVAARCFRLRFNRAAAGSTGVVLREVRFSNRALTANIDAKAVFESAEVDPRASDRDGERAVPDDAVVHGSAIVDLTAAMKPDGSLTWQVPEGDWTILRVGHTPTGRTNHPAPPEATGLECDKFSRAGLDASWNGMMQPLLDRLGPLAGQVLDHCLIDSYEVGGQNWTEAMAAEFRRRRGYDLTPFLPAFTGRVVDSPARTERFLWDFRRTVSDLFADNYYDHFTELCHRHGLRSMVEPYTGPFESLRAGGNADIPMGEFWQARAPDPSISLAASVGHTYGQRVVAAESLTGFPAQGSWQEDPFALKATGDVAFCHGINRFVFHRFAHQPWTDKLPGMTMGQWGINLDRTNTWFELAGPWIEYITRSQYLLQQGRPANDIAWFCGLSSPVLTRTGPVPTGYAADAINADVLLHRATVKNHRMLLPDGVSYALLVLPESDPNLTPELLRKLRGFVNDGLTLVGPRPGRSPSLEDFPRCDDEVRTLATEMWGDIDGGAVTAHALGQGKVVTGQPLSAVLDGLGVGPDFTVAAAGATPHVNFIHRTGDEGDIYFAANNDATPLQARCAFRVGGRVPELWHPDTGVTERAPVYAARDGVTTLPIRFEPSGSVFVVFREPDGADHLAVQPADAESFALHAMPDNTVELVAPAAGSYGFTTAAGVARTAVVPEVPKPTPIAGPWSLAFPPHWGAPEQATFDHLISWPDSPVDGIKYFSGTATYTKQIDIPAEDLGANRRLFLSLGTVKNLAQVSLNGRDLGILWKPPFELDVTGVARAGPNDLQVRVTNLWPNRLVGDERLPPDVEWDGMRLARWPQWLLDGKPSPSGRLTFTTWHHVTGDTPLLPSGLLGPVELRPAAVVPIK